MADSPPPPPRLPSFKLPPLSNPFFFQLMPTVGAGIGVGCGVGIGFGKPVALGAIPGLDGIGSGMAQVGHQLRGVHRVLKKGLAKSGLKGLDAGLGCGVGVGYGLGAGLFLKPGVAEGLVESGKELSAYAKDQLQARYGHLLPHPNEPDATTRLEDAAGGPSAHETSTGTRTEKAIAGNRVERGENRPKVSRLQGGQEAHERANMGTPASNGSSNEGSTAETRDVSSAVVQEVPLKGEGAPLNAPRLGKESQKGGTQSKKGNMGVTDKELSRLQLENDLLRETLRQRELIENLEGEVHALRESLNGTITCSTAKRTIGQCSNAPLGNLCFKCRQTVLGRRR